MLDIETIRKDFPMLNHPAAMAYLDNGATTFKPQCVLDAVNEYYRCYTANAHRGDYDYSLTVDRKYDECRRHVARFIHCDPKEVVFTYGTTSALNMAQYGYFRKLLKPGDVIITTLAEHASLILPLFDLAKETQAEIRYLPLEQGRVTVEGFKQVLDDKVRMVALAAVTNVMGYLAPVQQICQLAHEAGAKVLIDGAQAVPHMAIDVQAWDCDFLAFSGHKMCGPTGIGILYGKKQLLEEMTPIFYGGGANARFTKDGSVLLKDVPERFEAGTMPIEAVMGLDAAIGYLESLTMDAIHERETQLHRYAIEKLQQLDNLIIYNADNDSGIIAFNVKGVFAQDAAGYLAHQGLCLRSGNHCAKLLDNVIGTATTLRCSLYFYNTETEIDKLAEALKTTTVENCVDILL